MPGSKLNQDPFEDNNKPSAPQDEHQEAQSEKKNEFFAAKPENSAKNINIFSLYDEIRHLFSQYLKEEEGDVFFQLAVTKLDHLIWTLEPTLGAGTPIQYVLAAQCYYFKSACCLIAASQKGDEQIAHCHESKKYLQKAIEHGAGKNQGLTVLSDFSKALKKYYAELNKTIECYNKKAVLIQEKQRAKQPVLRDKLLRVLVSEGRFFNSLEKHCQVGLVTLNKEIYEKALEMMGEAINAGKGLYANAAPSPVGIST